MTWWNPVAPTTPPTPLMVEGQDPASVVTPEQYALMYNELVEQTILDTATHIVEDRLKRPLRNAIWKHRVRIYYDGYVDAIFGAAGAGFPPAIPIQRVITPGGAVIIDQCEVRYIIPDDVMLGFWGTTWVEQWGSVVYQGGWTPDTLPSDLGEIIMKVTHRIVQRRNSLDSGVPVAGISSPHIGDVGFTTDENYGTLLDTSDRKTLKRYVYRTP